MNRIKIIKNKDFLVLVDIYINFMPFKSKFYPTIIHDRENIYFTSRLQKKYSTNYLDYLKSFNKYFDKQSIVNIKKDVNICILSEFNIIGHTVEQLSNLSILTAFSNKKVLFPTSNKDDSKFYRDYINFFCKVMNIKKNTFNIDENRLFHFNKIIVPNFLSNKLKYSKVIKQYSLILYNYIKPKNEHQKTYNIKLNDDEYSASIKRGFNNNIDDVLNKYNYLKLPNDNEENKLKNLYESSKIILSWGSSHTINLIYSSTNLNKKILILCHKSYKKEYNNLLKYIPYTKNNNYLISDIKFVGNKCRFIFNLECDIGDDIEKFIREFEEKYS